ncbi:MAG TPA: rhomboid family intramembrane serine protease [Ferruginibacter sp.]|nr:rhomboid family intramembrane serine protease [Ferruginibacter sp.]
MGETDRYSDYRRKRSRMPLVYENGELISLLVIHVVVFMLMVTIRLMYTFTPETSNDFYTEIVPWFHLPADASVFISRPWTLLSYMFTETGATLIRLITNMVWLFTFGYILREVAGYGKLIPVFLYGGFAGGLLYLASYSFIASLQPAGAFTGMMGANTGVIAVAVAATVLNPSFRIFPMIRGGIPIWILTVIFLAIDLMGGVGNINQAYFIAHCGAMGAGLIFALLYRNGTDTGEWMNRLYSRFMGLFTPQKNKVSSRHFYETGNRAPYTKTPVVTASRVDEILDKINQKGFDQLTREEKEILKRASEEGEGL